MYICNSVFSFLPHCRLSTTFGCKNTTKKNKLYSRFVICIDHCMWCSVQNKNTHFFFCLLFFVFFIFLVLFLFLIIVASSLLILLTWIEGDTIENNEVGEEKKNLNPQNNCRFFFFFFYWNKSIFLGQCRNGLDLLLV